MNGQSEKMNEWSLIWRFLRDTNKRWDLGLSFIHSIDWLICSTAHKIQKSLENSKVQWLSIIVVGKSQLTYEYKGSLFPEENLDTFKCFWTTLADDVLILWRHFCRSQKVVFTVFCFQVHIRVVKFFELVFFKRTLTPSSGYQIKQIPQHWWRNVVVKN